MKNFKNVLAVVLFLMGATLFAQTNLTGKVIDDNNQALPGADVIVKGTTQGTSTDFDGNFNLETSNASGTVTISFIGYNPKNLAYSGSKDFGTVQLEASSESLDEVVIVGVADIAKDRKTPVAVSTIKATEIIEKLGSQEFPEILKGTPSVYATKQGGGFGDARINIRGFDQRNTAVMINGMPVNDMENGWVYWSNWAGLSDVTSAMQVQRGLGSSKLAISSVGGTINVLTRTSDSKEGGTVGYSMGNDNYMKYIASYSTGLMDSGFSTSILLGKTDGDGYVDGTKFEGYNYFLGFGYQKGNNSVQLTVTGAPQVHHQRGYAPSIGTYMQYGDAFGNPATKYNSDYGYRDGEEDTFGGNFYHKPIASLNLDFGLSEVSKISSVFYASLGRGGSIGSIGRINGGRSYYGQFKDSDGNIRFDDIVSWNQGNDVPDFGDPREGYSGGGGSQGLFIGGGDYDSDYVSDGGHIYSGENGFTQRSSMNSHNWFGVVANFSTEFNENLTFDFGVDGRLYRGIHYRRLVDLLGADGYVDNDNINTPNNFITETYEPEISNILNVFANVDDEQKIDYHNDGKVNWYGAFTQLEYSNDAITAFIQGGVSQQGFQRIDYFNYLDSDPEQTSDVQNILGGNVKGGINWNITEHSKFFGNAGYYSRQPNFDAVFPNYTNNDVNEGLINETIIGTEIGYGYRSANYRLDINLYRTSWADRFFRTSSSFDVLGTPNNDDDDVRGTANLEGITQIHQGVEVETSAKFNKLRVTLMGSVGDFVYDSDVTANYFDESENPIILPGETVAEEKTLYLKGKKVGDVAHITARLGLTYDILDNLSFDISQFYADKLYANIDAPAFANEDHPGSLELPSYSLMNAGLSYKLRFADGKYALKFRVNANNLMDHTYISESDTNYHVEDGDTTWNGVNTDNRVYFGYGRTWNASVRFTF